MADILIRGMEMPSSCADCSMCYDMMECTVPPLRFWYDRPENKQFDFCKERHPSCPLVELPEHGDLIDRKELCDGLVSNHPVVIYANTAPVIVPASEEAAHD